MQRGLPVLGFMVLLLRWQRGCILVQVIKPFDNAEKLRRPFFFNVARQISASFFSQIALA